VTRIRFVLALFAIAGAAALQADLKKALAEPDLEKRSKLALDNAFAAYQGARDAYQKGEMEQVQADIDEIEQSVDLAYQSLTDTGKNASFQDQMSYADRTLLDKVKARVQQVHDELLLGLMEGKKK
jgi:hypothetical protein